MVIKAFAGNYSSCRMSHTCQFCHHSNVHVLLLGHAVRARHPFYYIHAKTLRHREEEAAGCPFYHLVQSPFTDSGCSFSSCVWNKCQCPWILSYVFTLSHDHTVKVMFVISFVLENMSIDHAIKVIFVISFVLENMSIEHAVSKSCL